MSEWISVEDRLPEEMEYSEVSVYVLIYAGGTIYQAFLDNTSRTWIGIEGYELLRPTHWMPLLDPPSEPL